MTCTQINADILQDCILPPVEGVKSKIWIIPHSVYEVATIAMSADARFSGLIDVIDSFELTGSGNKAYVFEGYKASQKFTTTSKEREFAVPAYTHSWNGVVIPRNIEDKLTLDRLIKSRVVIIAENNDKGTDGELAFELYGDGVGLSHAEGTLEKNENAGGWNLTLSTPETESEPNAPLSIWKNDYATTKQMVEALEVEVPAVVIP